jgi:hypothetical protein
MVRTTEAGAAIEVLPEEVSVLEWWGTRTVDRPFGGGQVDVEDVMVGEMWWWWCWWYVVVDTAGYGWV